MLLTRVPDPDSRRVGLLGLNAVEFVPLELDKSETARRYGRAYDQGDFTREDLVRALGELDTAPRLDDLRKVYDDTELRLAVTASSAATLAKAMSAADVVTDARARIGGNGEVWPRRAYDVNLDEPSTHPRARTAPDPEVLKRMAADALEDPDEDKDDERGGGESRKSARPPRRGTLLPPAERDY